MKLRLAHKLGLLILLLVFLPEIAEAACPSASVMCASKLNSYGIVGQVNLNASKLNSYGVISPTIMAASKLNSYALLNGAILAASKLTSYAILTAAVVPTNPSGRGGLIFHNFPP